MKNYYFSVTNTTSFPLEIQYKNFCNNIVEPFDFIILNGGDTPDNVNKINSMATKLNVNCIQMPKSYHNDAQLLRDPSRGYACCINYLIHTYVKTLSDVKYLMFGHLDIFPITKISIEKILNGKSLACQLDFRPFNNGTVNYIFPMIVFIDMEKIKEIDTINFNNIYLRDNNNIDVPLDCGGCTYKYIKKYADDITIMDNTEIMYLEPSKLNIDKNIINFFNELKDCKSDSLIENTGSYCCGFYHFISGSNWVNRLGYGLKLALINKYFNGTVRAETGKKIISYSLYNDIAKNTYNAIINCMLSPKYYPGWICRFYMDNTVPVGLRQLLRTFEHVEVVIMPKHGESEAMLWRFLPASDPTVDIMISRDADSWVSSREAACVNEWLNSDKNFHIIRDHCYHTREIMGGMWGCRNHILPQMKDLVTEYIKTNTYDQGFLTKDIYPLVKNDMIIHLSEHIFQDTYLSDKEYARKYSGRSCPYPRDNGKLIPNYVELDDVITGLSFNRTHRLNGGKCGHCHVEHKTFIGAILQYLEHRACNLVHDRSSIFGIDTLTLTNDKDFLKNNRRTYVA